MGRSCVNILAAPVYNADNNSIALPQGKKSKLQKAATTHFAPAHLPTSSPAASTSFPLHTTGQKSNFNAAPAAISVPSLAPTADDKSSRQRAAAVAQRSMLKEQVDTPGLSRPYRIAHPETVSMPELSQGIVDSDVVPRKLFSARKDEGASESAAPRLTEQSSSQPVRGDAKAGLPTRTFPKVPCASSSGSSPESSRVVVSGAGDDSVESPPMEEPTDVGWDGLFGAGMLKVVSPGARSNANCSDNTTASKTSSASLEGGAAAKASQRQAVSASKDADGAFSATDSYTLRSISQGGSASKGSDAEGSHAGKVILGATEEQGLALATSGAVVEIPLGSDVGILRTLSAAAGLDVVGVASEGFDRLAEMAELPRPAAEYLSALGGLRRSAQLVSGLLRELQAASLVETEQVTPSATYAISQALVSVRNPSNLVLTYIGYKEPSPSAPTLGEAG